MTVRDTPWPAGTPCWVDLMTTDQPAAQEFYGHLFGWDITVGDDTTGGYAMAALDGHNVAGIAGMMGLEHPPVWSTYLATTDADATCAAVPAAGGNVVTPPTDVAEFGRMAFVEAPGGGVSGLWQAGTHTGFQVANEPNTVTWNEFMGRDYNVARSFFAEIFGYRYTEMSEGGFEYATIELAGNTVGGIGTLPAEVPAHVPPHWRVYFAVDDCDATVARLTELGGSVRRPPADMPYGRHADVADPQGALFSVITPASPAQ